jgi:2-iminobutanoate/2-iminopropanoate deaminase
MTMRTAALLTLALLAAASASRAQDRQVIAGPGAPSGRPYSPAVRVGDLLFLSGHVGVDPATRALVPGGIEAETRQALENIKALLESAGSALDRVVKCTVFLADIQNYAAMNRVYASYFPTDPPARSAVGVSGLPLGAAVEIECLALAGAGR